MPLTNPNVPITKKDLADFYTAILPYLGGGTENIEDLLDVTVTNLSNGQILKYNSTSQKWENATDAGGAEIDDTTTSSSSVWSSSKTSTEIGARTEINDTLTTTNNTWSANKIDSLISGLTGFDYEVVQTLPSQDISTHTIYLLPKSTSKTSNVYDEYIYVNNAWELIGDTTVDLSNYYTKTQTDTLLDDKQDTLTAGNNITIANNVISASGGGHAIIDSAGIGTTQRKNLQFTTPFTVSDDSTNDKTVIGQQTLSATDLDDFDEPSQMSPGISNFANLSDVQLSSPTSGQVPVYNGSKWVNGARDYHEYSTTEQVIGKWTDGKTLYEKVISFTIPTCTTEGTETNTTVNLNTTVKIGWIANSYIKLASGNLLSINTRPAINSGVVRIVIRSTDNSTLPNTFAVYNSSVTLSGLTCYAIIQYTKT